MLYKYWNPGDISTELACSKFMNEIFPSLISELIHVVNNYEWTVTC